MIHIVQSGDTLSKISARYYGNAGRWPEIYAANQAVIGSNPDRIFPGQRLTIPGLSSGGGSGPTVGPVGPTISPVSAGQSSIMPLLLIGAVALLLLRK